MKEHSVLQIVLSFGIVFTCVRELLLSYIFMCFRERETVEAFPCPQASFKDGIKKYIQREREKMATVARGGMVVIKKAGLGFVGVTQ